jgi:hypothetical protein
MTVQLKNRDRKPFVATLYHDVYCKKAGKCACTKRTFQQPARAPDGTEGWAVTEKLIPSSFRIEPKSTSDDLDDAVLHLPQVQAALNVRRPKLVQHLESKATKKPAGNKKAPPGGRGQAGRTPKGSSD